MRTRFFGIEFCPLDAETIARNVTETEPLPSFRMLVTANLDHVVQLRSDAAFRQAYDAAWLATIDGSPIHSYVCFRGGRGLPRVTGADLFPLVLDRLVPGLHRPFFVAAQHETASRIVAKLQRRGFALKDIGFVVPALGFDTNPAASAELVADIVANGTTHLFMGIGAPKSEIWMHRYRDDLPPAYGFGFGAALEYAAGTRVRAPRLFRDLGIEWIWRVGSEPRRLFHRYFVKSWRFLYAIIDDLQQSDARR